MVREFIQDRIDTAHALIDQGEYEQAVNLLKNIKHRIHENVTMQEINEFENTHDKKLNERITEIRTSTEHQLIKQSNEMDQLYKYATAYLRFYDNMTKHHDIL